jgi:hypothetical protein
MGGEINIFKALNFRILNLFVSFRGWCHFLIIFCASGFNYGEIREMAGGVLPLRFLVAGGMSEEGDAWTTNKKGWRERVLVDGVCAF